MTSVADAARAHCLSLFDQQLKATSEDAKECVEDDMFQLMVRGYLSYEENSRRHEIAENLAKAMESGPTPAMKALFEQHREEHPASCHPELITMDHKGRLGMLWTTGGVAGTTINFCPWCGFKGTPW